MDKWAPWVGSLGPWHLFGGLTFDQKRGVTPPPGAQRYGQRLRLSPVVGVDRATGDRDSRIRLSTRPMARDVALSKVQGFFRQGELLLGRQLGGVVALEYQRNGWPHFHPLINVEGGLQGGEISTLGRLWHRECGGNRLEVPRSIADVAAYAAKYLSKGLDAGDVVFWPSWGPLVRPARLTLVAGGSDGDGSPRVACVRGRGSNGRA